MSKEMKTLTIGGNTYEIVDEKARERLDNLVLGDEGGSSNYYVTPEQYGAKGDGVTDDTVAFDTAIATGMPIILGKKTYVVSGFVLDRDVDIRGNETTILAMGKEYSETSGLHVFACLEPLNIHISGVNIKPINHIVSIMTFNSVSSVHISNCELNGCTVNENGEYTTNGSNRGIGCDSCTNVTIKDSYIHNMYGMGVSFMSSTDIVLTNCRIEDTGRGGAYILSNNKNVNIENNIFRNNVRCYTVGDGSLDVYGTSNNEVRLTNNYIEGFGCEGVPSCGIRIKGSDNVVCEKNTIRTTADTYFLAAILICERYGIETTNCILRDNDILVEEIASSDIDGYLIRVTDQCDIKNLMILNNTMQTTASKYGISLRRGMEDVLIDGNYIKATLAIVVYNQEGYIRKNLRITNNSIYGAIDINYCYNTILDNNIVISDYSKPVNIANSDVLHIDGNTFTMDKDIAMSNCTNSFIGDNNTYIKSDSVSRSKKEFEIMIREESGQQITVPDMKATPSIKYYGDSVADESATVENMVEYTVFNKNGDLILNIGGQTLTDSVPKYAIRTKQKDLANYIDENGNAYISDYRDWENGVDWHYIRELVITGDETLYSSFPLIAYRLDQNWKESGIPYIGMYADNTPGFVRYDTPFVSNFYYRYSETDSTVNLPIYIASAKLLCIYPQNYNSSLKQFETEESWYAWCKEKYNAGTPLKVLYALYEPYTTPIPKDELAAYKALIIDGSDVEITSNANKKFEVSYFIDDMYTRGVKQLIDNSGFLKEEEAQDEFAKYIENITLNAEEIAITEDIVTLGTGWSGNNTNGYTHTSGNVEPLSFAINAADGEKYIVEYECDDTGNMLALKLGSLENLENIYSTHPYNGLDIHQWGLVCSGDNGILQIIPITNYSGYIKNLKCYKITENGEKEISVNLYNVGLGNLPNHIAGFYNFYLSPTSMQKSVNGTRNVAIGYASLRDIVSGGRNIGLGTFSLASLVYGENNIGIGADAGLNLALAENLVAIGKGAAAFGGKRTDDIAIGRYALTGKAGAETLNNIGIGVEAGRDCTGKANIFIGASAGAKSTSGGTNVFIGNSSGTAITTGWGNTFIGANANAGGNYSQTVAIGNGAKTTKHKQVVLGGDSTVETVLKGDIIVRGTDGVYREIALKENIPTIDETVEAVLAALTSAEGGVY